MPRLLTVRDLLLTGEPLSPAEVLAGEDWLDNRVSWVVSLRPYAPAIPRLRGGELALVATENLARLDLPPTLSDVLRQLAQLDASAVAVKGTVDPDSIALARAVRLPLICLSTDANMPDIEQAVMRECAMRHALAEVRPQTETEWLAELLEGDSDPDLTTTRLHNFDLAANYAIAFFAIIFRRHNSAVEQLEIVGLVDKFGATPVTQTQVTGGVAMLIPAAILDNFSGEIVGIGVPCGIGSPHPLATARRSLEEARLAATASTLLRDGETTHYDRLGADRLLLLLHRDAPDELRAFADDTLSPLLAHDARAATPLLPTFEAFIKHGGKLRETAAALYVHRNTLDYRLKRAEEILGLDPKEPETRLAIEVSLKCLRLVGGLGGK